MKQPGKLVWPMDGRNLEGEGEHWAYDGAEDEHGQGLNPFVIYPASYYDDGAKGWMLFDYRNVPVGHAPRNIAARGSLRHCKAEAARLHAEKDWPQTLTAANVQRI